MCVVCTTLSPSPSPYTGTHTDTKKLNNFKTIHAMTTRFWISSGKNLVVVIFAFQP